MRPKGMRDMAIEDDAQYWRLCRGCNVQFAVSPDEKEDIILLKLIHVFRVHLPWHRKPRVTRLQRLPLS